MFLIQDEQKFNKLYFKSFNDFVKFIERYSDCFSVQDEEMKSLKNRLKPKNHSSYSFYDFNVNVKYCTDNHNHYKWKVQQYTAIPFTFD